MLDTLRNSLSTKASELGGGARCAVLFGSRADTSFRLSRVHANFFIHSLGMLTKPGAFILIFWPFFNRLPLMPHTLLFYFVFPSHSNAINLWPRNNPILTLALKARGITMF